MTAKNRARPLPVPEDYAPKSLPVPAAPQLVPTPVMVPSRSSLQRTACPSEIQPRRFARVPTHTVGVHPEHREYPRATLKLPLRLRSINNTPEEFPVTLVTRDISSTGVYFLCPRPLPIGASIEIDVATAVLFWPPGPMFSVTSLLPCPDGMASPPRSTTCSSTATIVSLPVSSSPDSHVDYQLRLIDDPFIAAQFLMPPFQIFHSPRACRPERS